MMLPDNNPEEIPPHLRNCYVRLDHFLLMLPEPERHAAAIKLTSESLERMNRDELQTFRTALAQDPEFWSFLSPATRFELVDITDGQLLLLQNQPDAR